MINAVFPKLLNHEDLSQQEAEAVMNQIMSGEATSAQIGGYLIALRMKGETVDEITGSARAMRAHVTRVKPRTKNNVLIDTAGTGGDGSHTFNISTTAAFIIAGTGRRVAKHGNRAASSQCGSADVLAAAGVSLDLTPEQVATCIDEVGIGFLFAPNFHPSMKHAIGPRRELKQRTIFNMLGPLTNPAGATHQLIGVYDPNLTEPMAHVLGELGGKAAMVVHGHGGLDELTASGLNRVSQLRPDGSVQTYDLDPQKYGFTLNFQSDALRGGKPEHNATIMRRVLEGEPNNTRSDTVILNAAAALATETENMEVALVEARQSLSSGAALAKLEALISTSQRLAASASL